MVGPTLFPPTSHYSPIVHPPPCLSPLAKPQPQPLLNMSSSTAASVLASIASLDAIFRRGIEDGTILTVVGAHLEEIVSVLSQYYAFVY